MVNRCARWPQTVGACFVFCTSSVLVAEARWEFERGGVIFYAGFETKDADFSAVGSPKAILREGGAALTADGFDSTPRMRPV